MICQQVTLSGYAEGPKVADAVIEASISIGIKPILSITTRVLSPRKPIRVKSLNHTLMR
jgi:hypothetical protein